MALQIYSDCRFCIECVYREFARAVSSSAKHMCYLFQHLGWGTLVSGPHVHSQTLIGILNLECAVRPPGNMDAAIPEQAVPYIGRKNNWFFI
ncbi:hypothetical protein ACJX0J_042462, partial [Zea mays]